MKSSKKIVFFVASFSSIEATAPLGILAISTPLLDAGYDIRIIDASIAPDYKKRILEEVKDALCLGISLVTGPMIRETVDVAKAINTSRSPRGINISANRRPRSAIRPLARSRQASAVAGRAIRLAAAAASR